MFHPPVSSHSIPPGIKLNYAFTASRLCPPTLILNQILYEKSSLLSDLSLVIGGLEQQILLPEPGQLYYRSYANIERADFFSVVRLSKAQHLNIACMRFFTSLCCVQNDIQLYMSPSIAIPLRDKNAALCVSLITLSSQLPLRTYLPMLRIACRRRCSFSTRAMRM